jgi:hypothetical protein
MLMCRWMNGDVSFVSEQTKEDAIVLLDKSDNAEAAEISPIRDFMVDFRLTWSHPCVNAGTLGWAVICLERL